MSAGSTRSAAVSVLERGIAASVFPGAQAAWSLGDRFETVSSGATRRGGGDRVDDETLFDIASLTKPFVLSATLRLVARGELRPGLRLDALVPDLAGTIQGRATLEQLLAHEAGFADWAPLFRQVEGEARGTRAAAEQMLALALAVPPGGEPGAEAVYSDLGFIVLGRALELAAGKPLESVVADEVTKPLGLTTVHYRPRAILRRPAAAEGAGGRSRANDEDEGGLSSSAPSALRRMIESIAATEDCPWRGRVLEGEVHDDNAWAMGGVAGHAGLFATARDVAGMGAAWLVALEGGEWLPAELASRAIARRPLGRGLGWDLKSEAGSSAGELMGSRTFGHLGFTGCSLWIDPDRGLSVALLTNRVHPSRHGEGIKELRPVFHDALVGALE